MSIRTCIACGAKRPRKALLRFVRSETGALVLDWSLGLPGRGAHVCPATGCVERAFYRRLFNRALRSEVAYDGSRKLKTEIGNRLNLVFRGTARDGSADGLSS